MKAAHFQIALLLLCYWKGITVARQTTGRTTNNCSKKVYQIFETAHCLLCPLNALLVRCPNGTRQLTTGMGLKKCVLSFNLYGCVHLCSKEIVQSVCCENHWGPDCRPCPGMESGYPACFGNGNCSDLEAGNGTCQCDPGVEGFACEICTDKTKFGTGCEKECMCRNGMCDSGVLGNGTCQQFSCKTGYRGENCEIFEQSCTTCHKNSHCVGANKGCKCNPGYQGNGINCQGIDPCLNSNGLCGKNAVCQKTTPGQHKCVCRQGYTGDGVICSAIDPCQTSNGSCPANSTCNYLGPGKANCICLPGYDNFNVTTGCSIVNLCNDTDCPALNSGCFMRAPGQKECRCKNGYAGNGTVCYGNILQRIDDLHGYGQFNDSFRHVLNIIKYHSDLTFPFSERGPFTVFLPTDAGLETKLSQSQLSYIISDKRMVNDLIMAHSAKTFLRVSSLDGVGNLTTLKGWDAVVTDNGNAFYQLSGRTEKAQIATQDVFASNGIIHVIDQPVWIPDFTNLNRSLQTLWSIVTERPELRTFRDFIQAADMESELKKTTRSGVTLIAPVNEAFTGLNKTTVDFLKSPMGKPKLKAIIRHHIFGLKIGVIDLSYKTYILTFAPVLLSVDVSDKGALILGGKAKLIQNDIEATNGYLHLSDGLLIPEFVRPIVQRRCDGAYAKPKNSTCRPCRIQYVNGNCPANYVSTGTRFRCVYSIHYIFGTRSYPGCKTFCLPKIRECCEGFYGPDCLPCPGPIGHPCFGNGECSKADGTCKCRRNFQGTACELCAEKKKYGLDCAEDCRCHHGVCDNGRLGSGMCVPNSCQAGFSGEDCGTVMKSCVSSQHAVSCHIHGRCYLNNSQPICLCNAGYEKVGQSCYEIDPCLKESRGGCDKNAVCAKTAPGQNNCTCSVGWTGDGKYCKPIDYCEKPSRGHCHKNAKCTFLGPAQIKCECNPGYEGDGTSCSEINPCLRNNGDCSVWALCRKTGPGQRECTCRALYNGDGYTCLGSLAVVLKERKDLTKNLTKISSYIVKYNQFRFLVGSRNITVFLPSDAAMSDLNDDQKKLFDVSTNVFYFVGSNIARDLYSLSRLRDENVTNMTSWLDGVITVNHTESREPLIGGIARIVVANITASNGFIHIVDKVLLPRFLEAPRVEQDAYEGLCGRDSNFKEMCYFIRKFKLDGALRNCNPCSLVVPTDDTFHGLSPEEYDSINATDILYHMTDHYIMPETVLESVQQFVSLAGNFYILSFVRENQQVQVNRVNATYYNSSSKWVIYTVQNVLRAVKNTCYRDSKVVFRTQCRPCQFSNLRCSPGFRYAGREGCLYAAFGSYFIGCRIVCEKPIKVRRCCAGFWGKDCYACPGVNGDSCSSRGKCDDHGQCNCSGNYDGFACERCKPGHYGKSCKPCACHVSAMCDQKLGFCQCPEDKKGHTCDKDATYENCTKIEASGNQTTVTCAQHASCFRNTTTNATCKCDDGFTGNGTSCQRIDLCYGTNNPCSPYAKCTFETSNTNATCSCRTNYEGDGFYCRGINKCVKGRLKCHKNADCVYLRAGRATCKCKAGYSGDGKNSCSLISPCSLDNGGCSFAANCSFSENTFEMKCTCREGYIGNGTICVVNVFETIEKDSDLLEFYTRLQSCFIVCTNQLTLGCLLLRFDIYILKDAPVKRILTTQNHFSIIAPKNYAFASSRRKRRSANALADVDLRHYIIGCVALSEDDLQRTGQAFVTVAGSSLNVTSKMVLNYNVTVLHVKGIGNSAILVVDRLLDVPDDEHPENTTLLDVAKRKGYGKFVQLLTNADMLDMVTNSYYRPHTVFWPSDEAFARLPQDIHQRLFGDKDYTNIRLDILNYHIIEKTKVTTNDILGYSGGISRRTREGSPLYISCKGNKGDLYVNGQSKIIERDIGYQGGVAFGVADVLLPPGVAGRCDEISYEEIKGSCTACGDNGFCPPDASLMSVDKKSSCMYQYHGQYKGCWSRCLKRTKVEKCCRNFYGLDCQACPGELNPCNGRGKCNDGKTGNGTCSCEKSFLGLDCGRCSNASDCRDIISNSCTSQRNPCSIFATCDARRSPWCKCWSGYKGDGYYCQEIDKCQRENGGCSEHAICRYTGPNSASCECRSGYVGDGFTCTALSPSHPCVINNGNCHAHARCFDKGGKAFCSCRPDFVGNGIYCAGSVKDVIYNVEDLSEFAKNFKKLSFGVEGNNIIRYLSSEKEYTVFAPINYGFTVKSMNINDLKNHIVEGKVSLKLGKKTVFSLARNKIEVVVLENGDIRLNNIASVVSEYPATNGLVVVIDHVLPYIAPPPEPPKTTAPTTRVTTSKGDSVIVNASTAQKNNNARIIGAALGAVVFLVVIIVGVYCIKKRRQSYNVKYNRNFENVLLETEPYTEDDRIEDDEYEHQMLQVPSAEIEGTTVRNPSYVETDADIQSELLEMTETSSSVPLAEHDASSLWKGSKC